MVNQELSLVRMSEGLSEVYDKTINNAPCK